MIAHIIIYSIVLIGFLYLINQGADCIVQYINNNIEIILGIILGISGLIIINQTSINKQMINKSTMMREPSEQKIKGGDDMARQPSNKIVIRQFDIKPGKTANYSNMYDMEIQNMFVNGVVPKINHLPVNYEKAKFLSRILLPNAKREKYYRRTYEFKKTLHWGQLKLMLTEIEFLSNVLIDFQKQFKNNKELTIHVLYIGAAPGNHIEYLSKMFNTIHFDLYDPNEFAITDSKSVTTHVQFFTNKDAEEWNKKEKTNKYLAMISDIRTEPADDKNIRQNMNMQLDWWKIIQPDICMFKFRLPWEGNKFTEYPEGDIYIQPYPGPTSIETRLIVEKGAKMINYDNKKYEEQCFYHNNVMRKKHYSCLLGDELTLEKDSIDNCYDCVSLVSILDRYLFATNWLGTKNQRISHIKHLVNELQNNITFAKHNILSQTIKSLNFYIENIYENSHIDCKNDKCEIKINNGTRRYLNDKHQKKSVATEEALMKAINEASTSSHNNLALEQVAISEAMEASEKGTCHMSENILIK